ncbi:MAG: glycosyltransferase family 4 protein [Chloroflexota bacterium]|nr:glycosyltransferase family 4 protein [Chloroflexota bacterium]
MSRLLVLLPAVPGPLDTGAKIRNHGLLRLLSATHEVDALAFGSTASEAYLSGLVSRSTIVPEPGQRPAVRRSLDLVRADLPDMAWRRWSPAFLEALRGCVREREYAAVQAEGIEMARYLYAVRTDQRIYDAHNAEFLLQRRFSTTASSALRGSYSRLQWRRLERFERRVVQDSRLTLAVSQHDANQLTALAGQRANVRVIPNGVDAAAYAFVAPHPEQAANLLFLGKLDFRPNTEAAVWFVRDVLRPLFACVPNARLFAVGANPPRWLVEAGQHDNRIAVTGYVADERAYLARCAVLVLPLRAGGGTRLKALIAMASGLPIVSTRIGMEGLEAEPDQDYLVAESASEWVAALRRLLEDPRLRTRLAHNGRALVERRYDWSAVAASVSDVYAWLGS